MVLLSDKNVKDKIKKGKRAKSVVWERGTQLLGGKRETYQMPQVIDGNGNPVEPAYSEWIQADMDFKQNKPGDIPNQCVFLLVGEEHVDNERVHHQLFSHDIYLSHCCMFFFRVRNWFFAYDDGLIGGKE